MRKSSHVNNSNGKIINLLSFDTYRFDTAVSLLHHLWKGPLEIFVFSYFLYKEIDYYGWIGVILITSFVPIQSEFCCICFSENVKSFIFFTFSHFQIPIMTKVMMGKMTAKYRFHVVRQTDTRICMLNDIIKGIQIIKFYAWEKPFTNLVQQIRE